MRFALLTVWALCLPAVAEEAVPYPGPLPGAAEVLRADDGTPCGLKNDTIVWEAAPCFSVTTAEGTFSSEEDFSCSVPEAGEASLTPEPRTTASLPGRTLSSSFSCEQAGVSITWRAELREGAHYVREFYTLTATRAVVLEGFTPLLLEGAGFSIPGEVPGTPLVHEGEHAFYGVELPMAQAVAEPSCARMGFACRLPLTAGQSVTFSTVAGVFPEGQLRRAFLAYLERERAVPYHPFLQYNCRYDHGRNPTEVKLLNTIADYRRELVQQRGVLPDAFVVDAGWDDCRAELWQPHPEKFPRGFTPVNEALRSMGAHLGIRISAQGGDSGAAERVAQAVRMGLLPAGSREADLAQPAYRSWFSARCRELVEKDGVTYFMWDHVGDGVSPHFVALTEIARELRAVKPALFLCAAAGAWPSPFWLHFVDCTWRAGSADVAWLGEGSNRDRAITYRDAACYRLIVKRAPLYPLNSLMHHGPVLGREFQARLTSDMRRAEQEGALPVAPDMHASLSIDFPVDNDLRADARMFFAAGANLQELYLTPEMMDTRAWDDVAAAVVWSRRHADVLADAHWVGGDPAAGEVYGYAAWREDRGATLALRNPAAVRRRMALPLSAFEPLAPRRVTLRAAYADQRVQELPMQPDIPAVVELEPFEVLVFEADWGGASEKMTGK